MQAPRSFGPYTLLERISVGGMAEVFKAVRSGSNETVALKKILPGVAADEEFLELFQDEARIASQLEHRNIARILDFGEAASSHYIALEYVDGKPLATLIDRSLARGERVPIEIAVHVVAEVANGLAYAHDRKNAQGQPLDIVHRDVSPQNILLSFSGDTKLIDFGIAKAAGKITRTQAGSIKGKVGYMSPEQLAGTAIDRRSDIFALGICLWETLAHRRLFDAPNELLIMEQIRACRIVPPSSVDPRVVPELDRICLKALAKDPKERYATASEFEADLRAFARSLPVSGDATRVAAFMGRMFPSEAARHGGASHDHQESNRMSEKGGSDLDVFDGLAKKSQPRPSVPSQRGPAPPPPAARQKTLLGLAAPNLPPPPSGRHSAPGRPAPSGPPASGGPPATVRGVAPPPARSAPVPPRSGGSLPAPAPPPSRASRPGPARGPAPGPPVPSRGAAPPPPATRSAPPPPAPLPKPPPAAAAPVDMDWDDEDEKTSVFDKGSAETAATALLRSAPPPAPAAGTPPPPASARLGGAAALVTGSGGAAQSMPRPPMPEVQPQAPSPGYPPAAVPATPAVAPSGGMGRTIALAIIGLLVVGLIAAVVLLVLPSKGSLVVTVAGPGNKAVDAVEVFVDGAKRCGTSPCRVTSLKAGTHMVKVVAAGYEQTADQAVAVEKNTEAVLNVTLSRASEGTGIKVTAAGSGLRLSVDGKDVGPLPQELKDMTPGDHTIKISGSDRYKTFEKHITVTPDEMQVIEPKLHVIKGLARIVPGDGAKGAKVLLVSGHERRPIPKLPIKIDIQTDKSWSIVATRKGYEDYKQEITFEDGKAERTFKIDMVENGSAPSHASHAVASHHATTTTHHEAHASAAPAGKGTLNINSIPVSSVILDGRPLGTTPKVGIKVSPGAHTVVFVHPEYGRKVRSVSVSAGGTATAAVRFP